MNYWEILGLTIVAYLLGSFPIGAIYVKLRYGIYIKEHGDGTLSWQNIKQVVGTRAGIFAWILTYLKYLSFPAILYFGNHFGEVWGNAITPLSLLLFGIAGWLGENIPLFTPPPASNASKLVWGTTHALHTGAVILCLVLGWDLYLFLPNTGFVPHHLEGDTRWLPWLGILSLILTLLVILWIFPPEKRLALKREWLVRKLMYFHKSHLRRSKWFK